MSDALNALVHFFNDLIGAVVPGMFFIFGIACIHGGFNINEWWLIKKDIGGVWLFLLVISFITGHALLRLYQLYTNIKNELFQLPPVPDKIEKAESYKLFKNHISKNTVTGVSNLSISELRNIAMTISPDAATLARRFMFISLFCIGVGTALVLLILYFLYVNYHDIGKESVFLVFIMIFTSYLFFSRAQEFQYRALVSPFSIVIAELMASSNSENENSLKKFKRRIFTRR